MRIFMTTPVIRAGGFICYEIVSEELLTHLVLHPPLAARGVVLLRSNIRPSMPKGTVKWFNDKKGFGFIIHPESGEDVFVHFSVIEGGGYRSLKDGDEVDFDLERNQKGSRATRVVRK